MIYLRYVNPAVALLVFVLCLRVALQVHDGRGVSAMFDNPAFIFFLIFGLVCGSTLFILGKILETMLERRDVGMTSLHPGAPVSPPRTSRALTERAESWLLAVVMLLMAAVLVICLGL